MAAPNNLTSLRQDSFDFADDLLQDIAQDTKMLSDLIKELQQQGQQDVGAQGRLGYLLGAKKAFDEATNTRQKLRVLDKILLWVQEQLSQLPAQARAAGLDNPQPPPMPGPFGTEEGLEPNNTPQNTTRRFDELPSGVCTLINVANPSDTIKASFLEVGSGKYLVELPQRLADEATREEESSQGTVVAADGARTGCMDGVEPHNLAFAQDSVKRLWAD